MRITVTAAILAASIVSGCEEEPTPRNVLVKAEGFRVSKCAGGITPTCAKTYREIVIASQKLGDEKTPDAAKAIIAGCREAVAKYTAAAGEKPRPTFGCEGPGLR